MTPLRPTLRWPLLCLMSLITLNPDILAQDSIPDPIALGTRREVLLDDFLFQSMTGAKLQPHFPEAKEVALVCDAPWEGNTSAYFTLFEDHGKIRAWYRGSHADDKTQRPLHPEVTCYAESTDGVTFTRPDLGLIEYNGSKHNNIVLSGTEGTHNFTPFRDENPACPEDARYKALASERADVSGKTAPVLQAWKSPDGLRWTLIQEQPVITHGAFDSQNLAFFDTVSGVYRAYWRYFEPKGSVRAIRTATSKDFVHWEHEQDLRYADSPSEHLYTNAILPLATAPHLLIGFPTRFQPATQQVEPVFMSSRDGVMFRRWPTALIPITAPKDRDGNRSNYMARGLVSLASEPQNMSVYATEAYYAGPGSRIRRFVFRKEGFVSISAEESGTLTTKPLTFSGNTLMLNIRSHGPSRVELLDHSGQPFPGFSAADCQPIQGDNCEHTVHWSGGSLQALAGKPVRLRFELKQADLFAMQFQE